MYICFLTILNVLHMKFRVEMSYPKSDLIIEGNSLSVNETGAVSILDNSNKAIAVFPPGTIAYADDLVESVQ